MNIQGRLRDSETCAARNRFEAADTIEAQAARIARLEAAIEEAIVQLAWVEIGSTPDNNKAREIRANLMAAKGGTT